MISSCDNVPLSLTAMDSPLLSQLVSGSNITASIGGETKTTPIAFVSTTAKTQPGTSKPETSSIISSSILTSSQSTPVVKHQVLGKLMTANFGATGAAQNQQILVQNHQAGNYIFIYIYFFLCLSSKL